MNIQKFTFWSLSALLVILSFFFLVQINHTLNTVTGTGSVSFSGEGKVLAKPDIAVVSTSIVTDSTTSKVAQDENSKKSKAVTDFLKKQDVAEKDIKTIDYNVYPQYIYPRPCPLNTDYPCIEKPEISGYKVTQSFEIKIRDLEKIGTILDGLVSAGANRVNNLGLKIDDEEKLKSEARIKAIADAKSKAKELEKQVGIKLGRIVAFNADGNYPGPIYLEAKGGFGGDREGPSIPTGENEIVVNVTITYQIK